MELNLVKIGKAAKLLGISIKTLQRWDKSGKMPSIRKPGGHRYYNSKDIEDYLIEHKTPKQDLFMTAKYWVSNKKPFELEPFYYCQNSSIFQTKMMKLEKTLLEIKELKDIFSLITAVTGEIGNNSFDHNIGNWPDIPGIFFGYNLNKREIVLADRGQGILKTLNRVRPDLQNDEDALRVAFTEIISGRAPEERGNGLKFVRSIVLKNNIDLYFKTGSAEVEMKKNTIDLNIRKSNSSFRGCIALIKF
jgi:hypothetical protein